MERTAVILSILKFRDMKTSVLFCSIFATLVVAAHLCQFLKRGSQVYQAEKRAAPLVATALRTIEPVLQQVYDACRQGRRDTAAVNEMRLDSETDKRSSPVLQDAFSSIRPVIEQLYHACNSNMSSQ